MTQWMVVWCGLIGLLCLCRPGMADFPGGDQDCIHPCLQVMETAMDNTPLGTDRSAGSSGQLSWQQLLAVSKQQKVTEDSFRSICSAYANVDLCLLECEKANEQAGRIRQTYAGLRFICLEHRDEFFTNLPCLAHNEPLAMEKCRDEINQSLIASNLFSQSVINREHHNIRPRFASLCSDLRTMVGCIEPITRQGCGDVATHMMLKFITVGFSSFEQLYSTLGISDQLPHTCRALLSMREMQGPELQQQHPQARTLEATGYRTRSRNNGCSGEQAAIMISILMMLMNSF